MPPSERDTNGERHREEHEHTPPSREQYIEPEQGTEPGDAQEKGDDGYVPPSQRYGFGEPDQPYRLDWNDIEGPIHVKITLLLCVIGIKLWHLLICGIQWVVPRITGSTDPREGISGYFYPDDMISDDEFVVYEDNPSRLTMFGPYVVAVLLSLLAVVVTIGVPLGYGEAMLAAITPDAVELSVPERWWYFPLFLLGVSGLLLIRQALGRGSTWHIVTNRQVLHRANLINVTKQRFDLHEIQNLEDHYPPPERFYNVGHIDFYTAGTGGSEVHFHGVHDPGELIKEIKHYVRLDKQQRLQGGLSVEAPDGGHPSAHRGTRPPQESSRPSYMQEQHHQQSDRGEHSSVRPDERPDQSPKTPDEVLDEDDDDSADYPWRQSPENEGDSIDEHMSRQSLRDDMRDINDR